MKIEPYRRHQNALVVVALPRNCCRCGKDFLDYSLGRPARACLACKAPDRKVKGYKGKEAKLGDSLTIRDKQVIELIRFGKLNKEIAHELHIGEGTVKVYVSRIFIKTGMANRTILAVWWALTDGGAIQ